MILLTLLSFLLIVMVYFGLQNSKDFTLENVEIKQSNIVPDSEMNQICEKYLGKKIESINLIQIEDEIMSIDAVEQCIATVDYPNTIELKIKEKEILALLITNDKSFYLAIDGTHIVYRDFKSYPKRFVIKNPTKLNIEKDLPALKQFEYLNNNLESISSNISHFKFNQRGEIIMIMSDLKTEVILGDADIIPKSLSQFYDLYNSDIFSEKYYDLAYIDLRWNDQIILGNN